MNYLELWYEALLAPIGIVIETTDTTKLKQRLYKARTDANDPQLSELSIIISPTSPETQLWLVKKRPD